MPSKIMIRRVSPLSGEREGHENSLLHAMEPFPAQGAKSRSESRLVDRPDLVSQRPSGFSPHMDPGFSRIKGPDVAGDRQDDDPRPMLVARVIGDDDGGVRFSDLRAPRGIKGDPVDIPPTR